MTLTAVDAGYTYRVTELVKDVDGDTFWLKLSQIVDIGFHIKIEVEPMMDFRLDGFDTPELHKGSTFERAEALRAAQATTDFFTHHLKNDPEAGGPWYVWLKSRPDPDDFGRYFAIVRAGLSFDDNEDGVSLGGYLASLHLATVWPTRWWMMYDPHGRT